MERKVTAFDFGTLVSVIQRIDQHLAVQAGKAVNVSLSPAGRTLSSLLRGTGQNLY